MDSGAYSDVDEGVIFITPILSKKNQFAPNPLLFITHSIIREVYEVPFTIVTAFRCVAANNDICPNTTLDALSGTFA